jgi:hypothetical protein
MSLTKMSQPIAIKGEGGYQVEGHEPCYQSVTSRHPDQSSCVAAAAAPVSRVQRISVKHYTYQMFAAPL